MKIYLPLLDNGNGDVKASFMICHAKAFAGREVMMDRASDSHPDRGMNKIANAFLKTDCDVWINLDADIHFTAADVANLLSHDVPLVYGIYPKKQDDAPPCLGTFAELPVADPITGLARVRRCGRGFMLVRRELLERMKEDNGGHALRYHNHGQVEWNFFPSGTVTGARSVYPEGALDPDGFPMREWVSEDWLFCEHARQLGVETLVDTRIALGHEGAKVYRFGSDQLEVTEGWQAVPGWFTPGDAEVYRLFARELPAQARVAEVGCWMGRSLSALGSFLHEEGKHFCLSAIDTFQGTAGEGDAYDHREIGTPRMIFDAAMRNAGLAPVVYEMESAAAAALIADATLDALFLDGDHSYHGVLADLAAWLPKLKPGALLAGHDYDYDSVRSAVRHVFPFTGGQKIEQIGRCWLARLP